MNTSTTESGRQRRISKTSLRLLSIVVLLSLWAIYAYRQSSAGVESAPARSRVRDAQLVGAGQGWALTEQQLLWTTDGGRQWREITPQGRAAAAIQGVFFADAGHGWSVVAGAANLSNGATGLDLLRTSDGGATWQASTLAAPSPVYYNAGPAYLSFADAQHGWAAVRLATSSNFNAGALFQTSDGGATWSPLAIPVGGPISFTSAVDGWAVGGPMGDQLYATHDGGQSWARQSVSPPDAASQPVYDLPAFQSARDGVLPVTLIDQDRSSVGFYVTHDGGASWSLAQTVANPDSMVGQGMHVTAQVLDASTWLLAQPGGGQLHTTRDGGRSMRAVAASSLPAGVEKLDFVSADVGWAVASYGRCAGLKTQCTSHAELLATADGGQSWTRLNP